MTTMTNNDTQRQRIGLVFVNLKDESYQDELTELVRTANGEVVLVVNQNRQAYDSATLVGSGKLTEIAETVKTQEVEVLVFNEDLSPIQHRNISDAVDCLVIDRTNLILDIFAMRATTAEGKIQVELAQLEYELPRLRSEKGKLSRLGGGIGTRGPGETKLETDKRRIRDRITALKARLKEVEKRRNVTHAARERNEIPIVALVGYTNAGKSTLFNLLTRANVLAENKLFATLETTSRKITLPSGIPCLITDTVGFIRNLPHKLIDAFKSTLEETKYADILLNVCDASSSQADEHIAITNELLDELKTTGNRLTVYNKCDLLNSRDLLGESKLANTVVISATEHLGIEKLLNAIDELLLKRYCRVLLVAEYSKSGVITLANTYAVSYTVAYKNDTIEINMLIGRHYLNLFSDYTILFV